MKRMETRKTIRRYSKRDVSDALLQRLFTIAARTQTMGNLQLYSVVVTRSKEQKERLSPAHFNQPMVTGAPVVLTIVADFHRTTRWAQERDAVPGYDNFLSFINAQTDALLFTQTLCNLMEEEGLGCCFLGTTVYQPQAIIDALNLPRLTMPVATITVGWPDEDPPLQDRLATKAFVFEETYKPFDSKIIDQLYKDKEALEENRAFVKENHKQTLAQVYTDCRYTKSDNEAMSKTFIETLRRQGFIS